MSESFQDRQNKKDLLSAALVIVVYFAYMLTLAFAPGLLASPVATGSPVSFGLALGIAMALFMIVFSAWYTRRRNRHEERSAESPEQS